MLHFINKYMHDISDLSKIFENLKNAIIMENGINIKDALV